MLNIPYTERAEFKTALLSQLDKRLRKLRAVIDNEPVEANVDTVTEEIARVQQMRRELTGKADAASEMFLTAYA